MIRRRLHITGHVQGVFYRAWFAEEAESLGLDGWIRNRADGSVEAVVQGPSEAVDRMIDKAREGSPAARVDYVAVSEEPAGEVLQGFETRATR
jgi:acylphosphatase